ncbi:MAG: hypothetical protein A2378_00390 [Candidatus Pacebacteria bacterium RIFOXYB1_FULL_44_10]|nr:MAG: hypothetical protein A2378_00390 [Candidatus Pacebacteria bacterium RIFOXYB1_FULL_44_10]
MIRNIKAFTLIELLITMAILAVITTVVAGNFAGSTQKGRDARRKSDLKQLQTALEAYMNDKGEYPTYEGGSSFFSYLDASGIPVSVDTGESFAIGNVVYMSKVPADPNSSYTYLYVPDADTHPRAYQIFTHLENEKDKEYALSFETDVTDCQFGVSSSNISMDTPLVAGNRSCKKE